MNRKEAINVVRCNWPEGRHQLSEALKTLIPELQESEDERMLKAALVGIEYLERELSWDAIGDTDILDVKAYLERQKDKVVKIDHDREQKPAEDWREKRKKECPFRRNLDNNLYGCERYAGVVYACDGNCSWVVDYPKLKEIQDKRERKPADWSEKDETMLKSILDEYKSMVTEKRIWLKTLPERFNTEPKQEWSEEDERMINVAIRSCEQTVEDYPNDKVRFKDCIAWLKSLRPRPHTVSIKNATKFGILEYERGVKDGIQSEKSRHWKPSEE